VADDVTRSSRPTRGTPDYLMPLWRALGVFRIAAFVYAVITVSEDFPHYRHPVGGWIVLGVMAFWTAVTVLRYPTARARLLPAADLAVTGLCVASTTWIETPARLAAGAPPMAVMWMGGAVLVWAIAHGRRAGLFAGAAIAACNLAIHLPWTDYSIAQLTFAPGLLLLAGAAVGHLARLAVEAQTAIERGARVEAAARERERLARAVHDSVLQVLTRVAKQGLAAGGEAAELGRLAGEQEAALRALISASVADLAETESGQSDLRTSISALGSASVSVSAPATVVMVPARVAQEVSSAVRAALENVHQHAGPRAHAWILIEDEPDAVTLTVRDDGPGFEPGRLEQAATVGRLGVAQSILGRVRDLGGEADVRAWPGEGAEVVLRIPRQARGTGTADAHYL
jgi:signal transduction histidine kinase